MSDIDPNSIKAGKYVVTALRWDEITSKPGEPFDFVRHNRGDTVDLNIEQARRLVLAGAVAKPGDEAEAKVPGSGPSVAPGTEGEQTAPATPVTGELDINAGVDKVLEWVGEDKARATEALAAEQAKDAPRTTLVPKLEALANPQV